VIVDCRSGLTPHTHHSNTPRAPWVRGRTVGRRSGGHHSLTSLQYARRALGARTVGTHSPYTSLQYATRALGDRSGGRSDLIPSPPSPYTHSGTNHLTRASSISTPHITRPTPLGPPRRSGTNHLTRASSFSTPHITRPTPLGAPRRSSTNHPKGASSISTPHTSRSTPLGPPDGQQCWLAVDYLDSENLHNNRCIGSAFIELTTRRGGQVAHHLTNTVRRALGIRSDQAGANQISRSHIISQTQSGAR
jgi:hypothetical protein